MFFKKKDKRYNSSMDNYTDKYKGNFYLGLVYVALGVIGYIIYKIFFE